MRVRLSLVILLASPAPYAQDFSALDAAAGQALFERNWVTAPASTTASDGLGPYFNARSCATCHEDGGAGKLAPEAMNLVVNDPVYGQVLQLRAIAGMKPEAQAAIAFTHSSTHTLSGGDNVELARPALVLRALQHGGDAATLAGSVSLRRAPALHGLAALDRVPLALIHELADPDDRNGDGISGKVADGRFGWRAETATLREQVARALSLDLGLSSPQFASPAGDCTNAQPACHGAAHAVTGDEFEAPALVVDLILAFLENLPPPRSPALTGAGFGLFSQLGCAACHLPQFEFAGQKLPAFSDLLLHDLGPGLASAGNSEWRTAMLWNLGQSAHFLHDGRAGTLEEALLWHGGEAARSAEAYRNLNPGQRAVLHAWLLGL